MVRIHWRDEILDVSRLVLSASFPTKLLDTFRRLAQEYGLVLDSQETNPRVGDLWIGAAPSRGWGSESKRIGWAQGFEAYLVLNLLRQANPVELEPALVVNR